MSPAPPVSVPPGPETRVRFVDVGFAAAAPWYDGLTRVFSFGLDDWWRSACLGRAELGAGHVVLDIATGTGELALAARAALGAGSVVAGVDCCAEMLQEARRKARGASGTLWIQGHAEALPFRTASFDRLTVGFALRHFLLDEALAEMTRVIKPGGRLVVLEWTRPGGALARRLLLGYMRQVIPPLVRLVSRDPTVAALARYLPESIEAFVPGAQLTERLRAAGLVPAGRREYFRGLVSICVGVRPQPSGVPRPSIEPGRQMAEAQRPRYRGWVVLVGAALLGIVAVQLGVAMIGLFTG